MGQQISLKLLCTKHIELSTTRCSDSQAVEVLVGGAERQEVSVGAIREVVQVLFCFLMICNCDVVSLRAIKLNVPCRRVKKKK